MRLWTYDSEHTTSPHATQRATFSAVERRRNPRLKIAPVSNMNKGIKAYQSLSEPNERATTAATTWTVVDLGACFLAPPVIAQVDQNSTHRTSNTNKPLDKSPKYNDKTVQANNHGFASYNLRSHETSSAGERPKDDAISQTTAAAPMALGIIAENERLA